MTQRVLVLGASGKLGSQVVQQALQAGHAVSVLVRNPARLPADWQGRVTVHQADLAVVTPADLAPLLQGHDALVNTAGHVADGQAFVDLFDRLVTAVELLPPDRRPLGWFLAGAGLLDLDDRGRRGLDLPRVRSTYWPHARNAERLQRSTLDWRLLCPGPMVEGPALGVPRLRVSQGRVPVSMPGYADRLPDLLLLLLFARRMPEMIVSYADAAALMLSQLSPGGAASRQRVGLALPVGMKGRKDQWAAH